MASNKSKTPDPIQVVVVLMLSVLAFYFGNRFGQVFDFNTMEITDGALATVNSIVAAPAAISTASVPMLYAIGLAITVLIVWLYTFMYAGNYRYGEEAGSAKWGTLKEGVAFKDQTDPSNNLLFTKNYGLALKKPKFDLEHDRNLNVMVIGGSGSGKTRNYVKPNLMQLNASYFLTDPKGTSLPECGYLFRDNGYRIKVFNTIEFNKSMHYNPLKYVKTDADILSFVNCLISNTNGDKQSGGDPFWENSERLLYTALIALLRDWFPPEDYSLDGLLTLLSMAEAKENDENFKSPLDMIFDEIETGKVYERNPFYQGPSTSSSYADAESDRMAISENTTDEFTWQSSLVMLIQLIKISQRIDGTATLPAIKDIVFLIIYATIFIWLLKNSLKICAGAYDLFNEMIGKINQSTVDELKTVTIADSCKESFGAVIGIWVQSMIFDLITIIIKGSVSVMCYMRAMQLYVMAAFSPLPFALLGFDETKNYGVSFCKNFLATCLAGVIILFAMGLFPNLLSGFSGGEISGFKGDMWSSVCASVALMLIVIKSGTIARDVFGG